MRLRSSALAVLVVLAVTVVGATGAVPELPEETRRAMARDRGHTMALVDAARAAGEYERAEDEIRGYLERWRYDIDLVELQDLEQSMKRYVEMRELLERAAGDSSAAARYLALVTEHTDPSSKAQEQARALVVLARHHPALAALMARTFPARLVVDVDVKDDVGPDEPRILLSNALFDLTRKQAVRFDGRGEGKGTLTVLVTIRENDKRNSLLEGTAMKSYATHVVVELSDEDGRPVLEAATTTAMLGINPGNACKYGMSKVADRLFTELMAELARRVDRGDLP